MFSRPPDTSRATAPAALRPDGRVTVVAEAAQGYEGNLTVATLIVRAAAAAGADVVKLQLVYANELTTPDHRHYGLFRNLEMEDACWQDVAAESRRCGIGLAFDVFGQRSLNMALACGAHAVKIHASDILNHHFVAEAIRRAPHVYLSTGGIAAEEMAQVLARHPAAIDRATAMYGFQGEPTANCDNHLARLAVLRRRFPTLRFGFMDHADGATDEAVWLGVLAVPYGVVVIEKHLTLDRALALEDYVSAVAPERFAQFVKRIRAAEAAIGRDDLTLTSAEQEYRRKALKVVVAVQPLAARSPIEADGIRLLRAPLEAHRAPLFALELARGRTLRRGIDTGRPIYEDDLA